ncbi:Arm DNA-binding domain-containing protein [Pedobacter sp. L105]|uniref:Arm DNA-binding domain-containing protein n=1 Tax=Pedobacter sp. L105 TaxID=1641871 RepID=UPI00131D70C5|nr:Arm DNA-binding domain-containing protein [Pedobacter sp. L105]
MKTASNTFGVPFYLKKQKATQAGKPPIYARITVNSKRIEISVKCSIEENKWNPVKGMVRGSRQEISSYYLKLIVLLCYRKNNSIYLHGNTCKI